MSAVLLLFVGYSIHGYYVGCEQIEFHMLKMSEGSAQAATMGICSELGLQCVHIK